MIRVSCIIATYGSDEWAERAVLAPYESARGQGFHDVVIHHDPNGTLADVRNEGAFLSKGEALVFLDADDELRPGYLEAMSPWLTPRYYIGIGDVETTRPPEDERPLLLVPSVEFVDVATGRRQAPRIPQQGFWPGLNECVIGTAVSRALFAEVGGFRDLPSLEDYDLWLRCFDAGAQLQYVPEAVYVAHMREGSRNADQSTYHEIWQDHLDRVNE